MQNQSIREWWQPGAVLASEPDSPVAGRPVANLSFAINYAAGGLDVRGYRATNIALHLACALLVFAIVRRTLELPRVRPMAGPHAVDLALAAALVWGLHPLNSEVVNYLSQRTESLMAVCFLGSLYAAIRAASAGRAAWWSVLAVVSCGLGMASKESMAVAPVVVALYDRVFLYGSWREALGRRGPLYAGLGATWVVLAVLLASDARSESAGFSAGVTVWTYLLNQAVMIARYLRLAVWPDALVAFYGWPVPLTLGEVWPQGMLVVCLLAATLVALVRAPLVGFLGAWFFIMLAPASSIVPVATEVGAERRMYLPLLAVIVLGVLAAHGLWRRAAPGAAPYAAAARVVPLVVLGALCGALALATVARNREYASPVTLARTIVERWPTAVAYHILGEHLVQAGDSVEAVEQFREAAARGNTRARYPLGLELLNEGRLAEGIDQLESFIRTAAPAERPVPRWLEPPAIEVLRARSALATAYGRQRQWLEAEKQARQVLAVAPAHVDSRGALADALFAQERWGEAAAEYRQLLASRPDMTSAWINLGIAAVVEEDLDGALAAFRRAVAADPRSAPARRLLALALGDSGELDEATRQAREAIALGADDADMRDLAGRTLPDPP